VITDVGSRTLTEVDYTWAEAWIRAMKLEKRLAPGSIRKRKGALSNVFDLIVRAHPTCLGSNPLDQLPHGYSGYDEYTRQALAEQGVDIPGDVERNRRVDPAEERRIVEVLKQRSVAAPTVQEQAEAEGLSLMFQLALQTAMRMRELYTLQQAEIRIEEKTIYLSKSKNGDRRQVPLNRQARVLLETSWVALDATREGGQFFRFGTAAPIPRLSLRRPPGSRVCSPTCLLKRSPMTCISMTADMKRSVAGFSDLVC
jgi:integrase